MPVRGLHQLDLAVADLSARSRSTSLCSAAPPIGRNRRPKMTLSSRMAPESAHAYVGSSWTSAVRAIALNSEVVSGGGCSPVA